MYSDKPPEPPLFIRASRASFFSWVSISFSFHMILRTLIFLHSHRDHPVHMTLFFSYVWASGASSFLMSLSSLFFHTRAFKLNTLALFTWVSGDFVFPAPSECPSFTCASAVSFFACISLRASSFLTSLWIAITSPLELFFSLELLESHPFTMTYGAGILGFFLVLGYPIPEENEN